MGRFCFILTMRNVNIVMDVIIGLIFGGFILTMRNVNLIFFLSTYHGNKSFILTMRNVNVKFPPSIGLIPLVLY